MSARIKTICDEIRTIILRVKPEYTDGGVWTVASINRVAYEDLSPPYAVIELDRADPDTEGEYGPANNTYLINPMVWIVQEQTWDGLEVATDLELIRDEFANPSVPFQSFQIEDVGAIEWGDELEPNMFFANKANASRAGRFGIKIQSGESLNG